MKLGPYMDLTASHRPDITSRHLQADKFPNANSGAATIGISPFLLGAFALKVPYKLLCASNLGRNMLKLKPFQGVKCESPGISAHIPILFEVHI